jgi:hypothetical protein
MSRMIGHLRPAHLHGLGINVVVAGCDFVTLESIEQPLDTMSALLSSCMRALFAVTLIAPGAAAATMLPLVATPNDSTFGQPVLLKVNRDGRGYWNSDFL